MPRSKTIPSLHDTLTAAVADRLWPPIAILLGQSNDVAKLACLLPGEIVCYQMDLFPAEQLRGEIMDRGALARVVTAPDFWDLPAEFQTVIYPALKGGERGLKVDMVEQAFHILKPHGALLVPSANETDELFSAQLKKVFGKVHSPLAPNGRVFWGQRSGDRPRRRHEMTFHAKVGDAPALNFVTRPGTFAYGRFDDGARALVESMTIQPGDRVLDIGCGCGPNGIFAGRASGPEGHVVFVDSNVRAVALAELNARANGLTHFETLASFTLEGLAPASFDVALANPPYYAQQSIARLFVQRGRRLLKPGGRFYLVTKQPDAIGPFIAEAFGRADIMMRRGYTVLSAVVPVS